MYIFIFSRFNLKRQCTLLTFGVSAAELAVTPSTDATKSDYNIEITR